MNAQNSRAGGKFLAVERGAIETYEVEQPGKPTAPLVEFLTPEAILALAAMYQRLPAKIDLKH